MDSLEQEYAPPDHPVFQLTPPLFHTRASAIYAQIGSPTVTRETFWDIYLKVLACFKDALTEQTESSSGLDNIVATHLGDIENIEDELPIPLLEGMKELRHGAPVPTDQENEDNEEMYASFTETESEGDSSDLEDLE